MNRPPCRFALFSSTLFGLGVAAANPTPQATDVKDHPSPYVRALAIVGMPMEQARRTLTGLGFVATDAEWFKQGEVNLRPVAEGEAGVTYVQLAAGGDKDGVPWLFDLGSKAVRRIGTSNCALANRGDTKIVLSLPHPSAGAGSPGALLAGGFFAVPAWFVRILNSDGDDAGKTASTLSPERLKKALGRDAPTIRGMGGDVYGVFSDETTHAYLLRLMPRSKGGSAVDFQFDPKGPGGTIRVHLGKPAGPSTEVAGKALGLRFPKAPLKQDGERWVASFTYEGLRCTAESYVKGQIESFAFSL